MSQEQPTCGYVFVPRFLTVENMYLIFRGYLIEYIHQATWLSRCSVYNCTQLCKFRKLQDFLVKNIVNNSFSRTFPNSVQSCLTILPQMVHDTPLYEYAGYTLTLFSCNNHVMKLIQLIKWYSKHVSQVISSFWHQLIKYCLPVSEKDIACKWLGCHNHVIGKSLIAAVIFEISAYLDCSRFLLWFWGYLFN